MRQNKEKEEKEKEAEKVEVEDGEEEEKARVGAKEEVEEERRRIQEVFLEKVLEDLELTEDEENCCGFRGIEPVGCRLYLCCCFETKWKFKGLGELLKHCDM